MSLSYGPFRWLGVKKTKAYIQLRRKTIRVGSWRWLDPHRHHFALEIPTLWYPNAKHKICVPPTQNLNASQWNIGCVGSPSQTFLRWPCRFHVVYPVFFHARYSCNANAGLNGMWAYNGLFYKLTNYLLGPQEFLLNTFPYVKIELVPAPTRSFPQIALYRHLQAMICSTFFSLS